MHARIFLTITVALWSLGAAGQAARAAGLNLGWGAQCPSTAASQADATDPCDNTGMHTLVGSVVAPSGLTAVTGEELFVDLQSASTTLPDFWHLEGGGCRDGSLHAQASFAGLPTSVCKNYWGTSASGGFTWVPGYGGGNRARLQMVFARAQATAGAMTAGTEYYLFQAMIDGNHAVADTSAGITLCAGCQEPACFVFTQATLTQPVGVGDAVITTGDVRQLVTWQGGSGCTEQTTWGQVRSFYR